MKVLRILLIGIWNFIKMNNLSNIKIAVIGLGYVGLPLAVEFGKKYKTVGFDINKLRVSQLESGHDLTKEVTKETLSESIYLTYSYNLTDVSTCNIFIVTVPTPIDNKNNPDLVPLKTASESIGSILKKNDIVIYESTVYPGATEEICVPILEKSSGLIFNKDFFCGYSPERINPGDKEHTIKDIKKVTSGSTPEIADFIDNLYKSIITAGTHKAANIKIAEAAKVIENTQRDINIALINELAIIFNKLNIDTEAVLEAAGTKWNFLPFRPGLVGGHCIGVDPYYLTYKSKEIGYVPEIILTGRNLNNSMSYFVVDQVSDLMLEKGIKINNSNILLMGITFKENCPDTRNSKIFDIAESFIKLGSNLHVYDPWVDINTISKDYDIDFIHEIKQDYYDSIILAVAHDEFKKLSIHDYKKYLKKTSVLYDLKYILNYGDVDGRL